MSNNEQQVELDMVMEQVGGLSRYQIVRIILVLFTLYAHSIKGLNFVVYSAVPNYRCLIPECENTTTIEYTPSWLRNAVPYRDRNPERCQRYSKHISTALTNESESFDNLTCSSRQAFNRNASVHCNQYVFENDFIGIAREFQLFCDDNLWKLTMPTSMHFLGVLIFVPIAGYLSDRFGRKTVFVTFLLIEATVRELQSVLSFNYWIVLVFELLDGMTCSAVYPAAFILLMELLGPTYRSTGGMLASCAHALADITFTVIAMYANDWRQLLQITAAPPFLALLYLWMLPESVRWLLVNKQTTKAQHIIGKIADSNGVKGYDVPKITSNEDTSTTEEFKEIFHYRPLLTRLTCCILCWIACTFLTYGITLGSVTIVGNMFVNLMVIALMDVFGCMLALLCVQTIGRKWTLCLGFWFTAITMGIFVVLTSHWVHRMFPNYLKLGIYFMGKCAASVAFNTVYIYTTELFPTAFRQRIMGICSSIGRIGAILAPQMSILAIFWIPFPFAVFTAIGFLAGGLCLIFPETLGTTLPDTFQQALVIEKQKSTN